PSWAVRSPRTGSPYASTRSPISTVAWLLTRQRPNRRARGPSTWQERRSQRARATAPACPAAHSGFDAAWRSRPGAAAGTAGTTSLITFLSLALLLWRAYGWPGPKGNGVFPTRGGAGPGSRG